MSFGQLWSRSYRLANGLVGLGVTPGQRVAVLMKNCHQYIESVLGIATMGGVVVPVNWRLKAGELEYVLGDAAPGVVICGEEFMDALTAVRDLDGAGRRVVVVGRKRDGTTSYEQWLAESSDAYVDHAGKADDVVVQMYTSGTTGFPKGALLTHRNIATTIIAILLASGARHDDVFLNCLPFFHIGVLATLAYAAAGAPNVILRDFSPEEAARAAEREGATSALVVPTELDFILRGGGSSNRSWRRMRRINYGAMPISPGLLAEALAYFGCEFSQIYGMTETGVCTVLAPEDHVAGSARLGSAGRAFVLADVRIADAEGQEVNVGEVGEVVVRSESVLHGYWKLPTESRRAVVDGWFHTGDLARSDERGYVYLVDRKTDMIISGGENIYPAEVEAVLRGHPAVRAAAAIGVPDDVWGQVVKAVVALEPGRNATEEEIVAYCRDRLAGYKKPKSVDFVSELPMTGSGKVMRRVLREQYAQGPRRVGAVPRT